MHKMFKWSMVTIGMLVMLLAFTGAAQAATLNSGTWSVVTSVNPPGDDTLFAVAAISTNDVWSVGSADQGGFAPSTLAEHWNGSSWSVVATPNPGVGQTNKLFGVATNAWAVGSYTDQQGNTLTLAEHWNGSTWSIVPGANPGSAGNSLYGITAVSANNLWAVGSYSTGTVTKTLAERWDGKKWAVVASPNPKVGNGYNVFNSVTAISANDLWAVGSSGFASGSGSFVPNTPFPVTLIAHWNGTKWSAVSSPNPGSGGNVLYGVSGVHGDSQVWAVGSYDNGARPVLTLTELYS